MKLLSILSVLGTADKASSEHMYEILQARTRVNPSCSLGTELQECMRRADSGVNVGYAIIYECVKLLGFGK